MCATAFETFLGVGRRRLTKLKAAVSGGMTSAPVDGRAEGHGAAKTWESREEWLSCDQFFHYMYEHLGEPLAELSDENLTTEDGLPEGSTATQVFQA